ncbi:nitroreductase family protein [Roseicyclus persicicus]|uniref:Putative NAD(P)H nitroreductase n=1 Tax=Roseicyclus persicicus TaxID=2650661 RepID=A0A7X6GYM4_9RHOB|nr:nitroreductase [Roseibacterium persicicum]NKX43676.1 nitroreductase [Roseibacterium persicicum]
MADMDPRTPLDFLLTRRSVPVRMLGDPVPDDATLRTLLTAAARVPDHGKLVPFRFEVLRKPAIARLARLTREIGTAQGRDPDKLEKQAGAFDDAPLTVAVICRPNTVSTVPLVEQEQSAALACLSLVNAAEAAGYGGHWLTSWMARDAAFLQAAFAIAAPEVVAGFVHLGTPRHQPADRPRPDIDALTRWIET